jgi:hypothetical protein
VKKRSSGLSNHCAAVGLTLIVAICSLGPTPGMAQTMPGRVYHDLVQRGNEKLARRVSKKLELRADPDDEDVESLLARWEEEAGGPESGYDWLAVARLWLRAGKAGRAEMALHRADESGEVAKALVLLDQARVAHLSGQPDLAGEAYWKGCELAAAAGSVEYWLDIEPLATPRELKEWDAFRTLPASQRDLCAFLRRFWNERALASAMTVGARIHQHYARMRFALDTYRRRGGRKGPTFSNELGRPRNAIFDDRGLVFLRMGDPDRLTTFAGNPSAGDRDVVSAECYQPNVSWAYDYPDGTRVYHFTSFAGLDDYWLIENLGLVYRCGDPAVSVQGQLTGSLTPVNENRFMVLGHRANLVLRDLYSSRQGLDPRYAELAQRMGNRPGQLPPNVTGASLGTEVLEAQRILRQEREWTLADGEFAVGLVPERPDVAANTRLLVEALQFRSPLASSNRVWLNAVIEAEHLTPAVLPGGQLRYRVDARWALVDERGELRRLSSSFETITERPLGKDESLPVRIAADLPPGTYRYTVVVRDFSPPPSGAKRRSGNYRHADLTVRDLEIRAPALSDIAVAADSGGTWSPGGGARLRASPAHATGPDGVAFAYYEAYNLTPGGAYVTRVQLEPEGEGNTFDLSFPGDTPAGTGTTKRLLRLDLADTDPGLYRMTVTVLDEESGQTTLPFGTRISVSRGRR